MKKIITSLFLFVFLSKLSSQVNDNCVNAIPLCTTPSFTFFANSGPGTIIDFTNTNAHNVSNPLNNPFPPNTGCLNSGELNPQWLLITIGNAGLLEFVFGAGNSLNPQAGCYDWAMWPYSPTTCNDIFNNTLPPIACNWNATCANGTGIASAAHYGAFGGNAGDFQPPIPVNACQQFIICISNFSGVNTLVSFQSLGTASLSCNPNCSPSYAICHGSSATIVPVNFAALSNPVFSIQPGGTSNTTGSFVVTPTVTSTYTTYITGTNAGNAVQTITSVSTVTVYPQPSAAPSVTQTSCTNTITSVDLNLTFDPGGSSANYTVNWSPIPNGVNSPTQTTFSGNITPGVYTATITTDQGCSTTTGFTVNPVPAPAIIAVNPLGTNHVITCISDVTLTALNASYNYTWSSNVGVYNTPVVVFTSTSVAVWTLLAENPASGCMATQSFVITQNTTPPTSTVSPLLQSITCNSSIMTVTATANPLVNITHNIISPQGGTYSAQSHSVIYTPGGIGTFTHCVINDVNGCSVCTTFTVSSNQLFPTYTLTSPQNFTLGCTTTSIANINIVGAAAGGGGAASYTVIGPPTSTAIVSGTLSGQSTYSVNVPGTWTVVVRDNVSFCETRTPVSILSQTLSPDISAIVPTLVLDCNVPKMTLKGQSTTPNVSYQWAYPATPGIVQGDTITVNSRTLFPTSPVVADYTLTITNNISTCKSFSVISIQQNLFPPKAVISNGGVPAITCKTSSLTLTNQSSTTIPPNLGFPYQNPIVGYIWEGPSPQEPSQLKTTYVAATTGIYTLTVKDMNNGCLAKTTATVGDNRVFPAVNKNPKDPEILDCGSVSKKISASLTSTSTAYTYNWISSGVPTGTNVLPTFEVSKPGVYRVTITDPTNGCSTSDEVAVVNGSLTADFDVQSSHGYAPFTATFFNNSASSSTVPAEASKNILAYWNFGNGTTMTTTANNLSPTTTYTLPGVYKITMYAIKGTCIDTDSATITVDIPSVMEIPNVFTPNGDNVNDFFFIKASNLAEISAVIFDRWGHKVYEVKTDKGNIEWDGKNQAGKDMAEGTYFYTIKATGKDGVPYNKKGTISLFR